ncbi:hypothetical protein HYV86_00615 [Candidatus Woesearchaeota archaeon]|nr:hypothetical protein [Candidatus Woesearchaeota archaeon]
MNNEQKISKVLEGGVQSLDVDFSSKEALEKFNFLSELAVRPALVLDYISCPGDGSAYSFFFDRLINLFGNPRNEFIERVKRDYCARYNEGLWNFNPREAFLDQCLRGSNEYVRDEFIGKVVRAGHRLYEQSGGMGWNRNEGGPRREVLQDKIVWGVQDAVLHEFYDLPKGYRFEQGSLYACQFDLDGLSEKRPLHPRDFRVAERKSSPVFPNL